MKQSYRRAIVATLVSTIMVAGLFVLISETSPSYAEAKNQVPKGFNFIVTGTTQLPVMRGEPLLRLEDTEYRIVCYSMGPMLSCVKK